MKLRTRLIAPLAILFLLAPLSGCAVDLVGPQEEGTTQQDSGAGSAPGDDAAEEDPAEGSGGEEDPAGDATADPAGEEPTSEGSVGVSKVSCDGELVIDKVGTVVQIDGDCDRVVITADITTVVAGKIGELVIEGDGNTLQVDGVTTLKVSGDVNTVLWAGQTPAVTDSGNGNTLTGS